MIFSMSDYDARADSLQSYNLGVAQMRIKHLEGQLAVSEEMVRKLKTAYLDMSRNFDEARVTAQKFWGVLEMLGSEFEVDIDALIWEDEGDEPMWDPIGETVGSA